MSADSANPTNRTDRGMLCRESVLLSPRHKQMGVGGGERGEGRGVKGKGGKGGGYRR